MGSGVVDIIIYTSRLKKTRLKGSEYLSFPYASKTEMERLCFDIGGSGHNVAVGLSKLGNKVGYIGKVGNDPNGKLVLSNLKEEGVNTEFVRVTDKAMTGVSLVFITSDGEKSILTYRGANALIEPKDVEENYFRELKWFVFTSIIGKKSVSALKRAVKLAKKNDVMILANPSITMITHQKRNLLQLLRKSDIIIMNREEAFKLMDASHEKDALKKMLEYCSFCVITLGKEGVLAADEEHVYRKSAFNVRVVDATGAGDGFTAGFLHWLMKTGSYEQALNFGNATAAMNIMSVGATKDLPSEKDVLDLLKRR